MKQKLNKIIKLLNKKRRLFSFCIFMILSSTLAGCLFQPSTTESRPNPQQAVCAISAASQSEQAAFSGESSKATMIWPVPAYHTIIAAFKSKDSTDEGHPGIDISAEDIYGKEIVAVQDCIVKDVLVNDSDAGYGVHLILDHGNGITTLYGQCSRILVSEGEHVSKGQVIAEVGSTGNATEPHLHFEVRIDDIPTDPNVFLISNAGN